MSDGVIVAIITSATSLILALVNAVIAWIQRRAQKKSGRQEQLDRIESAQAKEDERLARLEEHSELQYMSLLRLTVMDSDMPMSERLIAGKEYLARNGNGDVKKFYEELEKKVNT